ncbi:TonB-dependent receptor [Spirosoma luteolum]
MKPFLLVLLLLLTVRPLWSQSMLTGRVTDERGQPLPGANVLIRGTYDGGSTDTTGAFRFSTSRTDTATLFVSYVGYEPATRPITIGQTPALTIRLHELANELNTVVITAGAFEASDAKRMTMLKPIDIVTTAGAGADITAAMNLLPGTQRVGEQEGLFVRGGSNAEAKVVIDGMIVQNPYFSALPDVQSRGRFQPFMFRGTSFSTGGYSAQYGQALSSVLLLNTTDLGSSNGLTVSLNLASAGLTYDHTSARSSVSATAYYGNLKPLFALVPQTVDWFRVPTYGGSSLTYRLKPTKNGLLKLYGMYSDSQLGMNVRDLASETGRMALRQHNRNLFVTSTYTDQWADGRWTLNAGLSYSRDTDQTRFDSLDFDRSSERLQGRLVLSRQLGTGTHGAGTLLAGLEAHSIGLGNTVSGRSYRLRDNYGAVFVESQLYLSRHLAVQTGLRAEYASSLHRANLAPRLSVAYKTGRYSQIALAAGQFYQTPDHRYLYRNTSLTFERADHLILNYQRIYNKRTFRIETFYKNYAQLVREFTAQPGQPEPFDANPYRFPYGQTTNSGSGYARGFDVFWRDQQSVNGLDYWITYSYVDTKRLFQQYITTATPTFIANHTVSVITKRYFEPIKTNLGLTYTVSSGRPYYNPNRPASQFLTDRTPGVHNVSFSASHITSLKGNLLVLYATVDNLLNTQNVFTYRYTADGQTRYAVGPQSYRSFFVGAMLMLNKRATFDPSSL